MQQQFNEIRDPRRSQLLNVQPAQPGAPQGAGGPFQTSATVLPPGSIVLQQQPQQVLQLQATPQRPLQHGGATPGSVLMSAAAPVSQTGGALGIHPTVLQFPPVQVMQQQQQAPQPLHQQQQPPPQQPPPPQHPQPPHLRTVVLGHGQQQPPPPQQPRVQQMGGAAGMGAPQHQQRQGAAAAGGGGPRPMKRQAFTPLAGPPQKRMMMRSQGGRQQWQQQQQQHDQGGGPDPMQLDTPQQHNKAQGQIPALGSNATPLGSGNSTNAGSGSNPGSNSSNTPGVPHRAKQAAPKGPVFVLGDAQALIYVIMDYVAKQHKPGRGREAGYDLCKFKGDFFEAFK